ncbi:chromatin remodeling protein SHL isoform X2 [Medicago truncatula]|uniref:chromatin remodeling protein SHL isoform X2 n=1 Tax=Medicago truncatula TaxID=3880 RepID=UPI000D2F3454|nr:chromatin remodeling protein SHL isoform X2 [Medicago truncatula]
MRSSKPLIPTYVAIIEEMKADSRDVRVRWYYWPEETKKGRRHFHGSKELILSDHFDVQSVDTIEGKCTVHSLKKYMKLDVVGDDDFFCRFNYNSATGALTPDIVQVYCKCEMPYNPDEVMVQCDHCTDWWILNAVKDESDGVLDI